MAKTSYESFVKYLPYCQNDNHVRWLIHDYLFENKPVKTQRGFLMRLDKLKNLLKGYDKVGLLKELLNKFSYLVKVRYSIDVDEELLASLDED
jgi:hypothetical protein